MKKIFLTIAIAFAVISCEDATDITQPSEFNAGVAFQGVEDVKSGVFQIYDSANVTSGIEFTSHFTDECALGSSGNQGSTTHRLQLNPTNGFATNLWSSYNSVIRNANILFIGAGEVTPANAAEQALYDEALGENYALRAYAYSQLLAYFSQDLSDGSSLATPIFDNVPGSAFAPRRNTVDEVVTKINEDLTQAETLLTSAGTAYTNDFISIPFINALRARVAAYVGNYGAASNAANTVLNQFTLPTSANESQYRNVWQDVAGAGTSNEVIFKFNNTLTNGNNIGSIYNTNSSSASGSPLYEVSRNLYQTLENNFNSNGDIRRNVFIDASSTIVADYDNDPNPLFNDRLVVDKYPGDPALPGLTGGLTNDQKVFRTAEMHFILAEVAAEANRLGDVATQLKLVRDARYTTPAALPSYTSATEAWADILLERKLELAFEGHRYIDMKRLGTLANQNYDRNETDCSLYPSAECDLSVTDFRARALPIPLNEIQGNPGITQNSGY